MYILQWFKIVPFLSKNKMIMSIVFISLEQVQLLYADVITVFIPDGMIPNRCLWHFRGSLMTRHQCQQCCRWKLQVRKHQWRRERENRQERLRLRRQNATKKHNVFFNCPTANFLVIYAHFSTFSYVDNFLIWSSTQD